MFEICQTVWSSHDRSSQWQPEKSHTLNRMQTSNIKTAWCQIVCHLNMTRFLVRSVLSRTPLDAPRLPISRVAARFCFLSALTYLRTSHIYQVLRSIISSVSGGPRAARCCNAGTCTRAGTTWAAFALASSRITWTRAGSRSSGAAFAIAGTRNTWFRAGTRSTGAAFALAGSRIP